MNLREKWWPDVPQRLWDDWHWQQQNRLRSAMDIEKHFTLSDNEKRACVEATARFNMAVTPYYFSLIDPGNINDPVRRQSIPVMEELEKQVGEYDDPMAEDVHMPVEGLTHRYPDRALLYTTHNCPVYCRHCFRKRKVSDPHSAASKNQLAAGIDYVRRTPQIRDLLLSGGDPLTFSDERLDQILTELRQIKHLEIIRIATRNPVTLPQRITPELATIFRKHHPIYVNTHFNHLQECTYEASQALELLADSGCVLGNQMVLLKGVNEQASMVRSMNQWLLKYRCRPYYIFQCDATTGIAHFRTPIAKGLKIIEELRGWTSGLAVPHYVIDLPGGGGKISLLPESLHKRQASTWTFRNYAGKLFDYVEGQ
jgi:lysine 2,3-aminomutase